MLFENLTVKFHNFSMKVRGTFSYEIGLLVLALLIPIINYPNIYGSDAYELLWMAQIFAKRTLNSENTWLITPLSYLGFFPFSHYPVGVPLLFATLIMALSLFNLSLKSVVLIFDLFIIIILWFAARKMAKELFEDEWKRILLIGSFLFSPRVFSDVRMTISARLILTIIVIFILFYIIKIFKDFNMKQIYWIIGLLILSLFVHRLWLIILIFIPIIILVSLTRSYQKFRLYTVYLLIPTWIICFLIGLNVLFLDPSKIASPWFSNTNIFGLAVNLIIDYSLHVGLILIFMPLEVIRAAIQIIESSDVKKPEFLLNKSMINKYFDKTYHFFTKFLPDQTKCKDFDFFLLLALVPAAFLLPSYYCIVIFLPFFILLSVFGFISLVEGINREFPQVVPKIPLFLFALSFFYALFYSILFSNLLIVSFLLIGITGLLLLLREKGKINLKFLMLQNRDLIWKDIQLALIILCMISFTFVTIEGRDLSSSAKLEPWNRDFITKEEKEIINDMKTLGVNGYIIVFDPLISKRITGYSCLPALRTYFETGPPIYYGLVSKNDVLQNTIVSFEGFSNLTPFIWNNSKHPILSLLHQIMFLDISRRDDYDTLKAYSIQYIITARDGNSDLPYPYVQWVRNESRLFFPLFTTLPSRLPIIRSTQHLQLWKIY